MMRSWSLSQRASVQAARQHLLEILDSRDAWAEEQLIDLTGLTPRRFQLVMAMLLDEGVVLRHSPTPGASGFTSYRARLPVKPRAPTPQETASLTPEARAVLGHLSERPDTARRMSDLLNLPAIAVGGALEALMQQNFVSCRYVGMLTIYHGGEVNVA